MLGSDGRWAELSSQNERVVQQDEPAAASAGRQGGAGRSRFAALASQRERLADASDPEFQLASSRPASPEMRLVAGAA